MKVGRIVTLVVMVLSALWAPMIVNFEKLWDYLQQSLAWFCPPIVALFVMGILWKRANATGAKWTMAIGGILTIISILFSTIWKEADFRPHFLYFATVHFLVSCMAMYLGSMSAPAPSEEKLNNTIWTRAEYDEETVELQSLAWYKNYRYQGLALIVLTAIILFIY